MFITSTSKDSEDIDKYYISKSKEIGVDLSIINDLDRTGLILLDLLKNKIVDGTDVSSWRFSYWVERELINKLLKQKKSEKDTKRYTKMMNYHHNINNVAFFTDNILDKLINIYSQFQDNSGLISRVANEIEFNKFEKEDIPKHLFIATFYNAEINDLTTASYLEYRSRLSVIKYIVDYILYKRFEPDSEKACDSLKILGYDLTKFMILPSELRERIEILSKHKYVHLYPTFWQWFLWLFGGFILNDYKKMEYDFLSQKTGIPFEFIDQAFDSYDILFPTSSGWFNKNDYSNISSLKMFPTLFMGIGADYRRKIYTEDNKYSSMEFTGKHTFNDLKKWNNATYNFLIKKES